MSEPRITQTTLYDSPWTLEFAGAKDLGEIPTGSPPDGAPTRGGVSSNRRFSTNTHYISETVQDGDIVTMEG